MTSTTSAATAAAPCGQPCIDRNGVDAVRLALAALAGRHRALCDDGHNAVIFDTSAAPGTPPRRQIDRAVLALLHRQRWIETTPAATDGDEGREDGGALHYRLTRLGQEALRRLKSTTTTTGTAAPAVAARATGKGRQTSASTTPDSHAERALVWLHQRRDKAGKPLISSEQFAAGERLAADFWFGQMMPRTTIDWSRITDQRPSGGTSRPLELSERAHDARDRVHRALAALGPELAAVAVEVCCHGRGLEQVERALSYPSRSVKVLLDVALLALARHYGLLPPADFAPRQSAQQRHWGSDDYRPTIDGRD
jgi:Domain of unknown function (DUF6456)